MKTVCHAVLMTVVAGGLACGVETGESASASPASPSASPVELMPLSMNPGCYTEATPALATHLTSFIAIQKMQIAEMEEAHAAQFLTLLTKPILEDPTADEWKQDTATTQYSANAVARGEHWGVIEAGWVGQVQGAGSSTSPTSVGVVGTIRYQPLQTSAHVTVSGNPAHEIDVVVASSFVLLGGYGRACQQGVMLDLVPWEVNGTLVEKALVCRRGAGVPPLSEASCRQAAFQTWMGSVDLAGLPVVVINP